MRRPWLDGRLLDGPAAVGGEDHTSVAEPLLQGTGVVMMAQGALAPQRLFPIHMDRIIIIGNSGSGKTYLGQRLSDHFGHPLIHLDELFWEPGGFSVKRPKEVVFADVARLAQGERWVVEGVFGELAQAFCPRADHLIWLDLDWATCERGLLQRGSQSAAQRDPQAAEASFERLLAWAAAYPHRDGPRSQRGHRLIFEQFQGGKARLTTRPEVASFVAALAGG